tara:strand:+ start:1363 stop:1590 length:228 start_codon:yes stop_codon:yes gene_type:complete
MLKDRRKQWQKDCINFSWSRCGNVTIERGYDTPTRLKRVNAMLEADDHQTSFAWYNKELLARHVDRSPVKYKEVA